MTNCPVALAVVLQADGDALRHEGNTSNSQLAACAMLLQQVGHKYCFVSHLSLFSYTLFLDSLSMCSFSLLMLNVWTMFDSRSVSPCSPVWAVPVFSVSNRYENALT